jgi:hypothetical protein
MEGQAARAPSKNQGCRGELWAEAAIAARGQKRFDVRA